MNMTESEFTEAIKQRDPQAFKMLVDQYQSMVLNTCNSFVNDRDDAKDLSQEVFIKIYDSIHKFRGDSKLSTWIYRISVNKSLNFIRANKKKKLSKLDSITMNSTQLSEGSKSDETDLEIEQKGKSKILFAAIQTLSKNQQIAFRLNKLDGVSYNEIAEIMNISLPAVESLIHRAKMNLQKKLIDYYKKNLV